MNVHWSGSLSLVMVLNACGRGAADVPPSPAVTRAPVVYGQDGRLDWYAIEEPALKLLAHDSVAAMIPWGYLSSDEAGVPTVYGEPTLGAAYGLCADQRFRDQPTAAVCSGTLIAEDLLLTAGHCVPNLSECASSAWVFDYLYDADGTLAPMSADSIYRCVSVVVRPGIDLDGDIDMAVIQLDRPVVGRMPAVVAPTTTLRRGDPLVLAGYPNGIPLKVDAGGIVDQPRSQQGNYFIASVDAFSGNSGSGVFGADLRVLGVLTSGADDYESAGSCTVVATLDPDEADESVMYAHHAVKAACDRGYPSAWLCPESAAPSCGDGFCTGAEASEGCTPDCAGLFAVPAEWTCDAGWYAAGDDCDCACGAYDPDCDERDLDVVNCAPGSACNKDGTCVEPIPAGWVCAGYLYGDGDRCNCDCGLVDPDCENTRLGVTGCAPGGTCQPDGTCTVSMPAGWDCRRRFYGTGDGCDCNCGARDPDCDDPQAEVYGCLAGSACLEDGSCELGIPAGWVCDGAVYGAGDACDCNCGLYDPDCDRSGTVRNCNGNDVCAADGTCTARVVEPQPEQEPEAGPELAEAVAPEEAGSEPEPEATVEEALVVEEDAMDESDAESADGVKGVRGKTSGGCGGGEAGGAGGALAGAALVGVLALARRTRRRLG